MFKVVTIQQNGQNVIVGWVPEEAATVQGATLHSHVFESQACPEPSMDIRRFIDANPKRSFDLHKLVNNSPVCRTLEELKESEWIDWDFNWAPAEPEAEGE